MNKKKEEKKQPKAIDPEDLKNNLDAMVDQLGLIEGARTVMKNKVDYLKSEYGLEPAIVRKVAAAIYKANIEVEDEKHIAFNEILDAYNS